MTVDWPRIRIAVLGGDDRDPVIAGLAAEVGADVRAFGLAWPANMPSGVKRADSALDAVDGANYILLPIPIGLGLELYAPHEDDPILLDEDVLGRASEGAYLFCGRATPEIQAVAEAVGVTIYEYDPDRELMLLRGPAIVEGALQLTIQHTDVTINHAQVVVVGFGNIGKLLARSLRALGAQVHVAARNPIQRAGAYADGLFPLTLEELPQLAPTLDMVFSTVPARVVDRELLEQLPRDTLVLDIAPPPEHANLELAKELGHRAVWARGLGTRAPTTVGASQWKGLRRYITEIEQARSEGRSWEG